MKKQILFLALALVAFGFTKAQDSYTIKMTLKIEGMPPEYAGFAEQDMMNYLKGDKYKNEMSSMMGTSTTAYDGKKLTSISDQMGNKSGYTVSQTELDSMRAKNASDPKPKIEYTQEKKTIATYECTKAVITSIGKDGKEQQVIVWVTDKIKTNSSKGKKVGGRGMQMDFGDLNGYPLQIEMTQNQMGTEMKAIMTSVEVITTPIDDAIFTISTDGYTMMTYKEMMDKMKSMKKGN